MATKPKMTVAVRVLPGRRLVLDRGYMPFEELELPTAEAEQLIERGTVQLASDEPPDPRTGRRAPVRRVTRPRPRVSLDNARSM